MLTSSLKALLLTAALTAVNPCTMHQAVPVITDEQCLAANAFFEARGESLQGMQVVSEVVINRTKARGYPSDSCGVIFQKKQFSWTHQQPFAVILKVLKGDLSGFNLQDRQAYQMAITAACRAATGSRRVLPDGTLWYHAKGTRLVWTKGMQRVATVGQHVFYGSR